MGNRGGHELADKATKRSLEKRWTIQTTSYVPQVDPQPYCRNPAPRGFIIFDLILLFSEVSAHKRAQRLVLEVN